MGTNTLEMPYPDDLPEAFGKITEDFEQKLRFLVAAKLYEMGGISSGRAAELAEMNRVFFLGNLSRYRISLLNKKRGTDLHTITDQLQSIAIHFQLQ